MDYAALFQMTSVFNQSMARYVLSFDTSGCFLRHG